MHQEYPNAIINPHSEYQPYGTALLEETGFVVARTKFILAGDTGAATAQVGVTSSGSSVAKWARTRTCIDLVIDEEVYDREADTVHLRQRVPNADRFGNQTVCLRVAAFGPDGGSFEIGFSDGLSQRRYETVYTEGSTAGGTPILAYGECRQSITELSTTYLGADFFKNPAALSGTYKHVYAHLQVLADGEEPGPFRYSPEWLERQRCAPYVYQCPRGTPAYVRSATQITVPLVTPSPMRLNPPSIVNLAAAIDFKDFDEVVTTSAGGTTTGSDTHERGGSIRLSGFSGLTVGDWGQIDTDNAFLLEAELG